MNMRKLLGLLILNFVLFFLLVLLFIIKHYKKQLYEAKEINLKISNDYFNLEHIYSNSLIINTWFIVYRFSPDFNVISKKGKIDFINEFRSDKCNLMIVFSDTECKSCAEKINNSVLSVLDTCSIYNNIYIFTRFNSIRDYLIFCELNNTFKQKIFNIDFDFFNISNYSYCFLVDGDLKISNFFILDPLTVHYFKDYFNNLYVYLNK